MSVTDVQENMIWRQKVSLRFINVVYKRVSVIVLSSFYIVLYYSKLIVKAPQMYVAIKSAPMQIYCKIGNMSTK